jgi:hypothetical protein
MKNIWLRIKLETFQIRLKIAGKLSKFFEILKDNFNPKRNPHLYNWLKHVSAFFKKRARVIIQNQRNWAERIQIGHQFVVHEDD